VPPPLTEAEELEVALLLGYPADYRKVNPLFFGAFERINASQANYDKVIELLADLTALKAQISSAAKSAGIKMLDKGDVEFFGKGNAQYDALMSQKSVLAGEMSILCGVAKLNDITSGKGYQNSVYWGPSQCGKPSTQW